jgi:hypothetical protein
MIQSKDQGRRRWLLRDTVLGERSSAFGATGRVGSAILHHWAEAVVVAIALLLWAPRLTGPIDLRWDGGVYYVLGTSLATGHGYRILSEPGSPEALQYPPLLPAVVAVHEWALGTTNPDVVAPWLRKLYFVIFVAYALAVLALARRYLRPWFALAATTLCLLHLYTIFLSDLLFAELPFALVSVLFVLVAASGPPPSRPWLREMAAFALAAAGFLLRTAGVALFAAWIIEALTRRRWRLALARGALALVPIALWQAHVERVRTSDEYVHPAYEYQRAPYQYYNVAYAENIRLLDPFRPERGLADRHALVTRLVTNFTKMPAAIGEAVSAKAEFWRQALQQAQYRLLGRAVIPLRVVSVPIFGLAALVVAGLVVLIRRGTWLMVFIVLGSVALTCTTPWPRQFTRYLSPLAPFLIIAAVLALSRIDAVLRAPELGRVATLGRVALASVLVLTVAVQARAALWLFGERARGEGAAFVPGGTAGARFFYHDRSWRAWEEAVAWIDAHAPPDAIVATNALHFCYLRTGRRVVLPPMEADRGRARRLLEAVPVSYVIIDELEFQDVSRRYARPAVENDPVGWHLVYSIKGTQIYQRATGPQ